MLLLSVNNLGLAGKCKAGKHGLKCSQCPRGYYSEDGTHCQRCTNLKTTTDCANGCTSKSQCSEWPWALVSDSLVRSNGRCSRWSIIQSVTAHSTECSSPGPLGMSPHPSVSLAARHQAVPGHLPTLGLLWCVSLQRSRAVRSALSSPQPAVRRVSPAQSATTARAGTHSPARVRSALRAPPHQAGALTVWSSAVSSSCGSSMHTANAQAARAGDDCRSRGSSCHRRATHLLAYAAQLAESIVRRAHAQVCLAQYRGISQSVANARHS